jgi:formate hydrogenlyase subunit 6/NADH:ubiquinone oxidoreductase subunit I
MGSDPGGAVAGVEQLLLKIPWVDKTKCKCELDCRAAAQCKKQAIEVQPACEDEPGRACDFPRIDLEVCRKCGDCEKACPEHAVKMI